MDYELEDSGKREKFEGGAVRDSRTGKGRFDLITPVADRRVALVYEKGAIKYAARNWEKGMEISRCLDSAKRHINSFFLVCLARREGLSDDWLRAQGVNPNEDHLAQADWNLRAAMHFQEVRPESMDDLVGPIRDQGNVTVISAHRSEGA